ncbi:MAG: hypothetical protein ALECFALPRED_000681 [Alectoria fallacina]|uniref:Uncharacterized protein n=1 Tax=Alectoria fallacina TaxID=1903189 RepID=A0A8H3F688_9LECA|nr:MAG: hypothetical protein ALECFALPRED_000681 [Alectoria fallacina]
MNLLPPPPGLTAADDTRLLSLVQEHALEQGYAVVRLQTAQAGKSRDYGPQAKPHCTRSYLDKPRTQRSVNKSFKACFWHSPAARYAMYRELLGLLQKKKGQDKAELVRDGNPLTTIDPANTKERRTLLSDRLDGGSLPVAARLLGY